MEKSFVGDPVLWPGLVYAPLNNAGLLFALGAVIMSTGLIFEEFADDFGTAVCRRRTDAGWERIKVALALRSSSWSGAPADAELLICWVDDVPETQGPPRLVLSEALATNSQDGRMPFSRGLDSILPEGAAEDLEGRARSHQTYEQTVRMLDEQIKKLQGS